VYVPQTLTGFLSQDSLQEVEAYAALIGATEPVFPQARRGGDKKSVLIACCAARLGEKAERLHSLHGIEAKAKAALVRLAYDCGGRVFLNQATQGLYKSLDALVKTGLVLRRDFDGRPGFVLPFEVLFHASTLPDPERPVEDRLLAYLARLNKDKLVVLASRAGYSPSQVRKVDLLREYYSRIGDRFEAELKAFDERRLSMLEELLRRGGRGSLLTLDDEFEPAKNRQSSASAWSGAFGFDLLLTGAFGWGHPRRETPGQTAAFDLVARGFVVPWVDLTRSWGMVPRAPLLSAESTPYVMAHVQHRMEARLPEAARKLPAPAPRGPVASYADRILDDLLKLQVAVACGLVEVNKSGLVSRRALKTIAALIGAPEPYVDGHLAALALRYPQGGGKALLAGGVKYPAEILRRTVLEPAVTSAAFRVLSELDGWMGRRELAEFIDNHPKAAPWHFVDKKTTAEDPDPRGVELTGDLIIEILIRFGLLEAAEEAKKVRLTGLADRLDAAERDPSWRPLAAKEQPVRVQPNLDILVPLNAAPGLFEAASAFADLAVLDRMVRFVLTKESLMRGLDAGWTPEAILAWLEKPGRELPSTVREFVASIGRKKGEAAVLPCLALVRCDGLGVKEKILGMPGIEAAKLEGAEDAPFLAVFHPAPGELVALLKKKKIFAELVRIGEAADQAAGADGDTKTGRGRLSRGHPAVERELRDVMFDGSKVRLGYVRGNKWKKTGLVTIVGLRRGRVYFIDRDGMTSSLAVDSVDAILG
jgi:hypothetical protein